MAAASSSSPDGTAATVPFASDLVVITGAAGRVGTLAVQALRDRYPLRLVDRGWSDADEPGHIADAGVEDPLAVDLRDPEQSRRAIDGAHTVVHLAGDPSPQRSSSDVLRDVAGLTATVFDACDRAGVRRVVLASSVHAMGLYVREQAYPVRAGWPTRPCCPYGAAKVFDENLLAMLTERSGATGICLRLGMTGFPQPTNALAATHWLGDDDFAGLLRASMTAPVWFGTYFGMSDPEGSYWDPSAVAADLGFAFVQATPAPTAEEQPSPGSRCLMEPSTDRRTAWSPA